MKKITKYFIIIFSAVLMSVCGLELALHSQKGLKTVLNAGLKLFNYDALLKFSSGRGSLFKGIFLENAELEHENFVASANDISINVNVLSGLFIKINSINGNYTKNSQNIKISSKHIEINLFNGIHSARVIDGDIKIFKQSKQISHCADLSINLTKKDRKTLAYVISSSDVFYNNFIGKNVTIAGNITDNKVLNAQISALDSFFKDIKIGTVKSDALLSFSDDKVSFDLTNLSLMGCLMEITGIKKDDNLSGKIFIQSIEGQTFKHLLRKVHIHWLYPIVNFLQGSRIDFSYDGDNINWKFHPANRVSFCPILELKKIKSGLFELTSESIHDNNLVLSGQIKYDDNIEFDMDIENPNSEKILCEECSYLKNIKFLSGGQLMVSARFLEGSKKNSFFL